MWFAISFFCAAYGAGRASGELGVVAVVSTYALLAAATYGIANVRSGGSK